MKNLFQNLIWPATAGNVAWALVTLVITESWTEPTVLPRAIVLFLVAVYLTIGWLRVPGEGKWWYWLADFAHVVTIIVFAIATQLNEPWLERSLVSILLVTTGGHCLNVWGASSERWWLALSNALGVAVLFFSHLLCTNPYPWNLPVAVGVVLIAWGVTRARAA